MKMEKVQVFGNPADIYDFSNWEDLVSISTDGGNAGAIKKDGTVIVTGYNEYGACNVGDWKDIVMLDLGLVTVGLKKDGTVVTTGHQIAELPLNGNRLRDEAQTWKNIVHIEASSFTIIGVKSNGRVECIASYFTELEDQVHKWRNIKTASTSSNMIAGVTFDGKVLVAPGRMLEDAITDKALERLDELEGAVEVFVSQSYVAGLLPDGTLRIVNLIETIHDESIEKLDGTTDVVDINSRRNELFVLKEDGTVLFGGKGDEDEMKE